MVEVLLTENGLELVKDASECEMSFVVANFEGDVFDKLRRAQVRIVGPTVVHKCVAEQIVSVNADLCFDTYVHKTVVKCSDIL